MSGNEGQGERLLLLIAGALTELKEAGILDIDLEGAVTPQGLARYDQLMMEGPHALTFDAVRLGFWYCTGRLSEKDMDEVASAYGEEVLKDSAILLHTEEDPDESFDTAYACQMIAERLGGEPLEYLRRRETYIHQELPTCIDFRCPESDEEELL